MRPLELKISAFGPFKDLVELDFRELGESGIYLITGDTGAGKTSIFDAISYALFDDSSGGQRQAKMFRTLGAEDTDQTFVDLSFLLKGKIYRIVRNPEYMRKSMRGSGLTKEAAGATLYLDDGQVISSTTKVNEYIKTLLGLDQNQFKQIAMLAQGDFKKMLHADNNERQALFRKIFNTHKYQELEDYLKSVNSSIRSQADLAKLEFNNIVENLQLEDKDQFSKLAQNSGNDGHLYLQDQIKVFENSYETLDKKRKTIAGDLATSQKKIDSFEENESLKDKLAENKLKLENTRLEIEDLKAKLKETKLIEAEIDQLNKANTNLENLIPKYEEIDSLRDQIKSTEGDLETAKKDFTKLESDVEKQESEISSNKQYLEENKDTEKKIFEKEKEISQAQVRLEELKSLIDLDAKVNGLIKDEVKLAKKLGEITTQVNILSQDLNTQEHKYFMNQAGILAENLQEGDPCPVCGSSHHPKKASLETDVLSKEALEDMKVELDTKRGQREQVSVDLNSVESRLESLKEERSKYEYPENSDLEIILADKKSDLESHKEDLKALSNTFEKLIQVQVRNEKLLEQFEKNKKDLDASSLYVSKLEINLEKDREVFLNLSKGLDFESAEMAQKEIDKNSEKINTKKEEIESIIEAYQDARLKQENMVGIISEQESRLVEDFDFDISNERAMTDILKAQDKEFSNQMQDIKTSIEINKRQMVRYENYLKKQAELRDKYATINHLYQTVAGQIAGKENIKFEVFVQMTYFDEILSRANMRLSKMSQNQFSLSRKKEASNKSSQSGLEIEVFDKYIGKTRDIKTLSGGETFKASLALALGLSDTVQMYSGGVELNCMFVDEGFGSLDKDNLNQVMRSLNDLSHTNKLIGIISHVEELKTRIDKKIIVEKDSQNSSKAKIVLE